MAQRQPRRSYPQRKQSNRRPASDHRHYTYSSRKKYRRRQRNKRIILTIAIILAVILIGIFVFFLFLPVRGTYRVEVGTEVTLNDLLRIPDENASFAEDSEAFDVNTPGEYIIKIRTRGGVHTCRLVVEDTKPPVVETQNVIIGKGESCEAADFIASVEDATETRARFVKEPDLSLVGQEQEVVIDVLDAGGNRVEKTATLTILPIRYRLNLEAGASAPDVSSFTGEGTGTSASTADSVSGDSYFITDVTALDYNTVGEYDIEIMYNGTVYPAKICIVDTQPPQITSAEDFTVFLGDPIRYKEHITATDNTGTVNIEVDTSAVDTSQLGTYPVTYTVTDSSGNSATATVQMTIVEKTADEAALFERVDAILEEIITPDMSKTDQTWAIYGWIRNNVGWQNESPKDDYIKAATRALDWASGDCYAYFSIAKVMLTRAGIKNMDIERIPDGENDHYWNLVDVEDGHGWYHFDATPFEPLYTSCLCTDAELMALNSYGQYNYDRSKYPVIP